MGAVALRALLLTGEQIRAARAMARIEQVELARRAGISLETVKRLERMRGHVEANTRTIASITDAFAALGVVFDLDVGQGPGLRLAAAYPLAEAKPAPDAAS
jgi:transcriptional regulator with XRE-family HTH domain